MRWRNLMSNWWLQALAALLLVTAAVGLVVPTLQGDTLRGPRLVESTLGWRSLDWAPPIRGGVRDVYEIDRERAIQRKVERLGVEVVAALRWGEGIEAQVIRTGARELEVQVDEPSSLARLDQVLSRDFLDRPDSSRALHGSTVALRMARASLQSVSGIAPSDRRGNTRTHPGSPGPAGAVRSSRRPIPGLWRLHLGVRTPEGMSARWHGPQGSDAGRTCPGPPRSARWSDRPRAHRGQHRLARPRASRRPGMDSGVMRGLNGRHFAVAPPSAVAGLGDNPPPLSGWPAHHVSRFSGHRQLYGHTFETNLLGNHPRTVRAKEEFDEVIFCDVAASFRGCPNGDIRGLQLWEQDHDHGWSRLG